jgi:hypothetical protein
MRIVHYLRRALTLPPRQTARIACQMASARVRAAGSRARDLWLPTFSQLPKEMEGVPLLRLFAMPSLDLVRAQRWVIEGLSTQYVRHRFDLLGSGWTEVRLGMSCDGLEGRRFPAGPRPADVDAAGHWLRGAINRVNLPEARRRWSLIEPPYEPIDWQIDFKSGFRWSARQRSSALRYGDVAGADVKVPWELARMQHLPMLGLAEALARDEAQTDVVADVCREFRNQVIDFTATNPPRYGVNWVCTMDVAIRAVNWVVAYDLFLACGCEFDLPFTSLLVTSLFEHAQHIVAHLEWSETLRGNHYLANVCGLLILANY